MDLSAHAVFDRPNHLLSGACSADHFKPVIRPSWNSHHLGFPSLQNELSAQTGCLDLQTSVPISGPESTPPSKDRCLAFLLYLLLAISAGFLASLHNCRLLGGIQQWPILWCMCASYCPCIWLPCLPTTWTMCHLMQS